MKTIRSTALASAAICAVVLTSGITSASAAGPGIGDVSDAMVYGPSGPVGTVVADLTDEDDDYSTIPAPFAINFFGTKYEGLCITTNGTISPVLTPADGCSDDYDVDVENLALDSEAPVIAALALDLDPAEELWVPGVEVTSFGVSSGVATVTTATPHPFAAGDDFFSWFPADDPSFEEDNSGTVDSVPTPTSFTFAVGNADEPVRAVTGASVSIGDYDDVRDDTDADGLADDGFADVKQIFAGTTVIDGKQAVVITWYRIPTNDTVNSPLLSNTLQIVLIQEPTSEGETNGYDFTIQLNIGTATDNDDGYSAADPSESCDSDSDSEGGIDNCRWGMGWADFDPATATADPYELFADFPINQLIDSGGTTALVNNRLNSSVFGRYTWKMIDGVTVGFVAPSMDGGDDGPLNPAAPPVLGTVSPPASIPVGQAYSFGFTASGTAPIVFAVAAGSLPTGLSLDPNTGVVSGTPTELGTFTYTISATNAAGSVSATYTQVVAPTIRLPIVSG